MVVKVKDNLKLTDLEKLGFRERTFGVYGVGDYLPEHWYVKTYYLGKKEFYIETNHRYFCEDSDTLTNFRLFRNKGSILYDKEIKLKGCRRIVRLVLKDLLKMELVETVADK